jgi:lysozyme family protein
MTKPYEPVPIDGYLLPDGTMARIDEVVAATDHFRISQEIILIQRTLGVKDDGKIGPETRKAIRRLAETI